MLLEGVKMGYRGMKIGWRGLLLLVVLMMGSLAGSAATIKEEIEVSRENPFIAGFVVEEPGEIYAELELNKIMSPEDIELILQSPLGEQIKGYYVEGRYFLKCDVSGDTTGKWQISVIVLSSSAEKAYGTLTLTYPTTPPTSPTSPTPPATTETTPTGESETEPPTIIETTPTGENVPVETEITITFSEPMNSKSAEDAFYIYPEVAGKFYWKGNTMIFVPGNLSYDTRYFVRIEKGARDLAGNAMEESYEWDFKTTAPPTPTPPLIPPTAVISAIPGEINEGESVSFSAEASSDRDGEIVSYNWDFGDGDTGVGMNIEHTYYHSGQYNVTLTVTDNDGLSDSCSITVNIVTPNAPPTAYIHIYPNPVREGERVTFEGYGEDEDGEVVECRWTLPDGRTFLNSGSRFTFEREDIQAGWYSFAVRDDDGAWSEEVRLELELETSPIPWIWISAATAIAAVLLIIRKTFIKRNSNSKGGESREGREGDEKGSIYADSDPQNALVYLDTIYIGLSPVTVHEVPVGAHIVKFRKFGYFDCEREAIVDANQRTHVHCDLMKIPEIKLKLSAEPAEIPADGVSKSTITIRIEDNNGIPIPVPEDVMVELATDNGTIESPVKIPAGHAAVKTTLTSSTVRGTATVEAKAIFLKGSTEVEFYS